MLPTTRNIALRVEYRCGDDNPASNEWVSAEEMEMLDEHCNVFEQDRFMGDTTGIF